MSISFFFEVVGKFKSNELWEQLEPTGVNLMDLDNHIYIFGEVIPSTLVYIIITCGRFGSIKGGDFSCE